MCWNKNNLNATCIKYRLCRIFALFHLSDECLFSFKIWFFFSFFLKCFNSTILFLLLVCLFSYPSMQNFSPNRLSFLVFHTGNTQKNKCWIINLDEAKIVFFHVSRMSILYWCIVIFDNKRPHYFNYYASGKFWMIFVYHIC